MEFSSSSGSDTGYPQMDERVVAYLNRGSIPVNLNSGYISTDIGELKELFQVALNEDNFDPECDYFAIHITKGEGLSYFTISISKNYSNNLILYNIHPSLDQPDSPYNNLPDEAACMYPSVLRGHGFLICDKEGGLKDNLMLKFPQIMQYHDPTWNCWKPGEAIRDPFFELRE
jgi:hypothetical protein